MHKSKIFKEMYLFDELLKRGDPTTLGYGGTAVKRIYYCGSTRVCSEWKQPLMCEREIINHTPLSNHLPRAPFHEHKQFFILISAPGRSFGKSTLMSAPGALFRKNPVTAVLFNGYMTINV